MQGGLILHHTNSLCLSIGLLLVVLLVTASVSPAGVVIQVVPPYFGEIDLYPGGDTVTIAAQHGPAVPSAGRSVVTGGGSGRIILSSAEAEQVEVVYPDSLTLTRGADSLTVRGIPALSQNHVVLPGGGARVELSIGGHLELRGTERQGDYHGTMTLQINFY